MGANDEKFTSNYEINSLSMAHNCRVRDFTVSRWLKEGDLIYLDDARPEKNNSLEVKENEINSIYYCLFIYITDYLHTRPYV